MLVVITIVAFLVVTEIDGHGMMLEPPNRASLWRFKTGVPITYEDNQFFCGGVQVQYEQNNGLCGECGDNWKDPKPRSNENQGFYGNGIIFRNYTAGSVIETNVVLTANHLGTFTYSLCKLADSSQPETESCFKNLKLSSGTSTYQVNKNDYTVKNKVQLPAGVTCNHCVLRWHYRCGNSWGVCDDGTTGMGCGNQEIFRSCADIAIH